MLFFCVHDRWLGSIPTIVIKACLPHIAFIFGQHDLKVDVIILVKVRMQRKSQEVTGQAVASICTSRTACHNGAC